MLGLLFGHLGFRVYAPLFRVDRGAWCLHGTALAAFAQLVLAGPHASHIRGQHEPHLVHQAVVHSAAFITHVARQLLAFPNLHAHNRYTAL